jgi:hypothetical protein
MNPIPRLGVRTAVTCRHVGHRGRRNLKRGTVIPEAVAAIHQHRRNESVECTPKPSATIMDSVPRSSRHSSWRGAGTGRSNSGGPPQPISPSARADS